MTKEGTTANSTYGFNEGSGLIGKWITNKNTLEYLGVWEKINNSNFNYPEFGVIENEAGTNRFIIFDGQWINRTITIGLIVKQKIILDYLRQFGKAKQTELEAILLDKLPGVLDIQQKREMVKNNLQILEKQGIIAPVGKTWKMSKPEKITID